MSKSVRTAITLKVKYLKFCLKNVVCFTEDDDEKLKKAIVMSLGEETGVSCAKRENKAESNNFQVAHSQRQGL